MDTAAPTDPFAVATLDDLASLYDPPRELVLKKVAARLEARSRAFIAASPFMLLATQGPGGVHCTPRGDAPGFVAVLDDQTLQQGLITIGLIHLKNRIPGAIPLWSPQISSKEHVVTQPDTKIMRFVQPSFLGGNDII